MIYITNSFSLNVLPVIQPYGTHELTVTRITPAYAAEIMANNLWQSAVGHTDMAEMVTRLLPLGEAIPARRVGITITPDDLLIVAQYSGPRLPEGATTLPPDAAITFYAIGLTS